MEISFLSVKMKQSDWLRSLSERSAFCIRPARSVKELPALVFAPKTEE
jgi:hypothetical protein